MGWLIDTDPGLGLALADVDDALAILHLVARGVAVDGLTTSYGNASLPRTHRVALGLGERLGLPVFRGARRPGDGRSPAVDRLVAHRGPVLALAPFTNVAAALRAGARFERLVVLGGTDRRLPNLRPLHTTELNAAVDEPAARVVLESADVVCPMEPCRPLRFGRAELAKAPAWVRRGCRSWLWTSPLRTGRLAFVPWDLVPAVYLTHPQLFRCIHRVRVSMAGRPLWRGSVRTTGGGRSTVIRGVDAAGLRSVWADTLAIVAGTG